MPIERYTGTSDSVLQGREEANRKRMCDDAVKALDFAGSQATGLDPPLKDVAEYLPRAYSALRSEIYSGIPPIHPYFQRNAITRTLSPETGTVFPYKRKNARFYAYLPLSPEYNQDFSDLRFYHLLLNGNSMENIYKSKSP